MMPSGVALIPAEASGFGVDDPPPLRLRHVRKPPRKEPAGGWQAVCRLWGFERAATSAKAGLGVVVKGGLACIIENWSPPLRSTVRLRNDRRDRIGVRRHRGDGG